MAEPIKKVKRRVVPTHVVEEDIGASSKGALQKSEWSTRYQDHYKTLHEKGAVDKIRQRAIALGYEKERKVRVRSKKRADDGDHGTHDATLHHFGDYLKAFLSMRAHSKGVSMLDYLQKMFKKNMYFSSKTKRFRLVR
jgi:hypothetical protein